MYIENCLRGFGMIAGLCWILMPSVAQARQYGQLTITNDTTLKEDRFGAVIFGADNISLDCDHHQVHISSYTKENCAPSGTVAKCGIVVEGRTGVTIKNCDVVGDFYFGVEVWASKDVTIRNTTSTTNTLDFLFEDTSYVDAQFITANGGSGGVTVARDFSSLFRNVAIHDTVHSGVEIGSSHNTTFWTVDVTGAFSGSGFSSSHNENLYVGYLTVTDSLFGFSESSSKYFFLDSGSFVGNRAYGMRIDGSQFSQFERTLAQGNDFTSGTAPCDAYQINDAHNTWSGNTIQNRCGTVPPTD